MAESQFFDLIKCSSPTVGTGALTLGPAVLGFLDFTTGGVFDGDLVTYGMSDGPSPLTGQVNAGETGQGVASLSGGTWSLTRTVRKSTNGNAPIACTGRQVVVLTLGAEDLAGLSGTGPVGQVTGVFAADGSISPAVPAGAVLLGGKIVPSTSTDVTVSLGSFVGGDDILAKTLISGTPDPGVPLQGINFTKTVFAADQAVFVHSSAWDGASVTVVLWYLLPVPSSGPVSVVSGTFITDGAIGVQVPAGAVVIGGRLAANNSAGVTVSLGSTSGTSDVLPQNTVAGSPDPGIALQGINFTETIFAAAQTIFVHSPAWDGASVTVDIWFAGP